MVKRSLYSPAHDRTLAKKRSAKSSTRIVTSSEATLQPLSPILSEGERRALRARQLIGRNYAEPLGVDTGPLPDEDLDVVDPRGNQGNLVDGPTVFPNVLGPQPRTKMRALPGDPDLSQDISQDLFDVASSSDESGLIAAVSANDKAILNFDNRMSNTHDSLRALGQAADALLPAVKGRDQGSAGQAAQTIVDTIHAVLEPWFEQLEDQLRILIDATGEGMAVKGK